MGPQYRWRGKRMGKYGKYRLLVVLLASAILVIGVLAAGCGEDEESSDEPTDTTTAESSDQAQEESATTEAETEDTEEVETITLSYAAYYGPEHPATQADKKWIEKIEAETDGAVEIEPYWGASLVSREETFTEIKEGVADIATIKPGYSKTGFELHRAESTVFYYGAPDWETIYDVYNKVHEEYPEDPEWDEVKVLARSSLTSAAPYQLHSVNPVRTVEDFEGLTAKATGVWVNVITDLGGSGTAMPMSETYSSLEKNAIDAAIAPNETLKTMSFAEVTDYTTTLDIPIGIYPVRVMNLDVWNSLPSDVQEVFNDNIDYWGRTILEEAEKADEEGIEFALELGHEFIELPEEDMQVIYSAIEERAIESAAELDEKGLPGTGVYEMTRQLIEESTR